MYAGNATVVTFLMRFPVLIPPAVAIGIVAAVPPPPAPPPAPAPVVAPAPAPAPLPPLVVVKKAPPPAVEDLCPPPAKLTKAELKKLTTKERAALKVKGCIKG